MYAVARRNGLTPFSMYQGRWNAAFRDMESELIPMCEDQGMAIVPWAALGGGQLISADQRKKIEGDPNSGKGYYDASEDDIKVCDVLERLAKKKDTTLQALVSFKTAAVILTRINRPRPSRISSISLRMSFPLLVFRLSNTSSYCQLP